MLQVLNRIIHSSNSCADWTTGRDSSALSLLGDQQLVAKPEEEGSILWAKSSQSCQFQCCFLVSGRAGHCFSVILIILKGGLSVDFSDFLKELLGVEGWKARIRKRLILNLGLQAASRKVLVRAARALNLI